MIMNHRTNSDERRDTGQTGPRSLLDPAARA